MKLRELSNRVSEAEQALYQAIAERFTAGTRVTVRWGDYEVDAIVRRTSYDLVLVFNPSSGREYWVNAYRLIEFDSW